MLDPHGFALWDEKNPDRLPRCWSVTSDSIAARAAVLVGAGRLILLKSREGSIKEVVDAHFLGVVGKGVTVEVVNGRAVKN